MMYVTTKEMLRAAQAGKYAIGAFNCENMEMAMAIVAAAEAQHAPVMLQTTPSTVSYAGLDVYYANVRALAERASVPVALHLDHGSSYQLAIDAMAAGYSSVMIDGSHETFEDNIAVTRRVVEEAKAKNIPVEAELGKVGGKEDDLDGGAGNGYTDPADAVEFVKATGVDSLAVAIGTAHGVYVGTPVLDVARLAEIRRALEAAGVSIPLVLHGASGLTDESVRECIAEGICKVNFATELRQAYTAGVKEVLAKDPAVYDPKKYGKVAMAKVQALVEDRIKVCGANGKA
ncbi:MAG: class II fructose-bisphosphate aldolase [Clostridia bacterium]|nr:class II fructose-bisphosphate aldolase [Clostridia bacterium]